jgi:APA family basic amino acid/polyamine antiporter
MVIVKLSVVLFVIAVGSYYVDAANWEPFAPFGYTGIKLFDWQVAGQHDKGGPPVGMLAAASVIFFAYIGFDAVSTQAEEARNPKRDVPIAIIASLVICTVLYIAVAAVLTGMVPYNQIDKDAPVSAAFETIGLKWAQFLISVGAVAGITSVLLVMLLSQPRILLAMARDGLLPAKFFAAIHPRFQTPWRSTLLTGALVGVMAALLPIDVLSELVNIGTLLAFVIVCAAVMIMRRTHPEVERPFRAPFGDFVPVAGILLCLMLMFSLPWENWARLFGWLAIGLVIYFSYGHKHSIMARKFGPQ